MEELRPEELEALVQELEGESEEEEALSPEVEELLRDLAQASFGLARLKAAEDLGELSESSPRIVRALIAAGESDAFLGVREAALESLRAPVHQEILREYPDLMQHARSATEQTATQLAMLAREGRKRRIRVIPLVVGGLFALVGLVLGLAELKVGLFWESEARRIASYPVLVGPGFEAMAPGEHAVVVGVLEGNAVLEHGLVAFSREQWNVERHEWGPDAEDRDTWSGSWRSLETRMPGLAVSLDGDIVHTAGRDSGVRMEGRRHQIIYQRSQSGRLVDGISAGSLRIIGYKNGQLVTLVGEKDANGTLIPEVLYGGKRAQLLSARRDSGRSETLVGGGFLLIALILLAWLAVRLFRRIRARKREAANPG